MEKFLRRILALDRRWVFGLLFLVLFLPILFPLNLPGLKPSKPVQSMFDFVDRLKGDPGQESVILVSLDFDPASKPELAPMAEAVLRHAFRKKVKVVAMGLWVTGVGMQKELLDRVAAESNVEYGRDYVNLGWKPGSLAVITGMGEDIYNTFPTDARGTPTDQLELMKRVRRLKDFDLVVTFAAGTPGLDEWVAFGADKYKFKLGGGTTAVQTPAAMPYLQAGQIVGLIGAMRGAAEYELLIDKKGEGAKGMDAISLGHYLIIGLILLGNLAYFVTRRSGGAAR